MLAEPVCEMDTRGERDALGLRVPDLVAMLLGDADEEADGELVAEAEGDGELEIEIDGLPDSDGDGVPVCEMVSFALVEGEAEGDVVTDGDTEPRIVRDGDGERLGDRDDEGHHE
jgi:hypothetical protein